MALTSTYISESITTIESLQTLFANEFCNILKRQTGHEPIYETLDNINIAVSHIINVLQRYTAYGNSTLNDLFNYMTESDILSLINYCYRTLNKYKFNIYIPTDPNVYL